MRSKHRTVIDAMYLATTLLFASLFARGRTDWRAPRAELSGVDPATR